MKVESAPLGFRPVTLTLDTPEEVRFFRDVIGSTSVRTDKAYGIDNTASYEVFKYLDSMCDTLGIARPSVSIDIDVE